MIRLYDKRIYSLNDGSYAVITKTHEKNRVYKYHVFIKTETKQYEDDFCTLVEAENYLKDYEKGDLR